MAANEIVQGLLGNLLQPQSQGPSPQDIMAAIGSSNPMAAAMALNTPSMSNILGSNVRGLFAEAGIGKGTMGAEQALVQSMTGEDAPDLTKAAGLKQAAQNALAAGNRPMALQLTLQAQQLEAQEQAQQRAQGELATNRGAGLSYLAQLVEGAATPEIRNELAALANPVATGAIAVDKLPGVIKDIYARYKEEAPTRGLASAVTKTYMNGVVLQALPSGETVVRDASGVIVPPERRQEVLSQAAQFEREQAGGVAGARAAGASAIKKADEYYEQSKGIQTGITQIDEAVRLIDSGAATGRIAQMFPSVRQATVALEQLQREMGLNVIQNTTFGALSNAELNIALETALPTGLTGEGLKDWLLRKKTAQEKLLQYTQNAAAFLYTGGTMGEWLEEQKRLQGLQEQAQEATDTMTLRDGTVVRVRRAQ